MLKFNNFLKTSNDIDHVNKLSSFLAPNDSASITKTKIDIVIHAGNAILDTAIAACKIAQEQNCWLLFSGGIGHSTELLIKAVHNQYQIVPTKLEGKSEAEIVGYLAIEHWNFPAKRLILETKSTNCGQNASFTLDTLIKHNLSPKNAVIIQDPTMQRRTFVTFQKAWEASPFKTNFYNYPSFVPKLIFENNYIVYATHSADQLWSPDRFISLLLGEIPRLRDDKNGYGPKGKNFIAHVDIPKDIESAYYHLQKLVEQEKSVLNRNTIK